MWSWCSLCDVWGEFGIFFLDFEGVVLFIVGCLGVGCFFFYMGGVFYSVYVFYEKFFLKFIIFMR